MITYQVEKFADVIEEMKPLLQMHYEEIAMYKDRIALNPDYAAYQAMADLGMLHIYTARDSSRDLIGYCVTFIRPHPHYQDHIYAMNDVVYVAKEYRHTEVAPELISQLEKELQTKGVSVMTFHMKTYKPFRTLMDSLGFDCAEELYTKFIKG
jgi:GNAT superfamily N-acetyltransferase